MRVLVCGSREWDDPIMEDILSGVVDGFDTIIEGGARGADAMAAAFARWNCFHEQYPADWDTYGKSAGYRRNAQMLKEGKPDMVLAFGHGKGTDMMVELAVEAAVPTYRVIKES